MQQSNWRQALSWSNPPLISWEDGDIIKSVDEEEYDIIDMRGRYNNKKYDLPLLKEEVVLRNVRTDKLSTIPENKLQNFIKIR